MSTDRRTFAAGILVTTLAGGLQSARSKESFPMINIVPAPQEYLPGEGTLTLDNTTQIVASVGNEDAAAWLSDGLNLFAGIELEAGLGPTIHLKTKNFEASLPETIGGRADGNSPNCELYSIEVTPRGVTVIGVTVEAVFRGATSLLQLAAQNHGVLPVGTIIDAPRFAWRGLSLDTVRTFHSVDTVKQVIDLLALYKMNVLHFHITDSEGWRFQIDRWPLLTEISGSTARNDRPGGYYTTEEFADIVEYAADRFVTVVPEFDSPGHTASVITAYPELASEEIRAMPAAMQYLHPDQPQASTLMRDVFTAMAEQTNGSYIHIGGDEAIAMDHETFQRYIQIALPIARDTGKGVVAWQEAARGGLAEGDLMQWWIPDALVERVRNLKESGGSFGNFDMDSEVAKAFIELMSVADQDVPLALEQGANIILSPSQQLYLDTKYPEPSADPAQNEQHERVGMPQQIYDNGTVADSYNWDPLTLHGGIPADRLVGIEAAIWCEFIEDRDDLFFQLLPRLAGVSEKAWSTQQEWDDYRERLSVQPLFWDAMELPYFRSSVVWEN